MKSIIILLSFLILSISSFAQEPVEPTTPVEPVTPVAPDAPKGPDTTRLTFGNKKIIIIEEAEGNDMNIMIDDNGDTTYFNEKGKKQKKAKFYSTWSGLSIAGNGALTYDNKTTLPDDMRFIEIDYARSISAAFNFADVELGISPHFGFATGLGIQWNRYGIKNNYTVTFNEDSLYGISTPDFNYSRNVLKATYITMPLLFEIHTSKNKNKSFNLAFGVIGGYKLGSKLKQHYEFEGREYEFKTRGHYHFNPFQAYATARIGYGDVSLFFNYGLTRVFEEGRGPQLYPFQAGLHFSFN